MALAALGGSGTDKRLLKGAFQQISSNMNQSICRNIPNGDGHRSKSDEKPSNQAHIQLLSTYQHI